MWGLGQVRGSVYLVLLVVLLLLLLLVAVVPVGWELASLHLEAVDGQRHDSLDDVDEEVLTDPIWEYLSNLSHHGLEETSISTLAHGLSDGLTDNAGNLSGDTHSLTLAHVSVRDEDVVGQLGDDLGEGRLELEKAFHGEGLGWDEGKVRRVSLRLISEGGGELLGNLEFE